MWGSLTAWWSSIFSNFIALWLSCYTTLSETFIPCASKKYRIHNIWGNRSSPPTSSASVDLFVFSFCLFEAEYRAPLPIDIIPPLCLFMLWWTVNAASTHHFTVPVPSDSKVIMRSLVLMIYFRMRPSFLLFSSSGSLTLLVINYTLVRMYGCACLHIKGSLATIVWNAWASLSLRLRAISFTSKIWFDAGVMDSPWYLSGRSSRIFLGSLSCRYLPCSSCGGQASSLGICA